MELRKRRYFQQTVRIRTLFIKYLILSCIAILALAAGLLGIFFGLIGNGTISPANYASTQLELKSAEIASCPTVTRAVVPDFCDYAIYSENGDYQYGNIGQADAKRIWKLTQEDKSNQEGYQFFKTIQRDNEICVIRYTYQANFASEILREHLPKPFTLIACLFVVGTILIIFLLGSVFGKQLKRRLAVAEEATAKIQNHDLNFTIQRSGITEIDEMLLSLEQMRAALKESLERQWKMEQNRREQISALAHDIKTPLTVIHGNTDLLAEMRQTAEQQQCTGYILSAANQIDQYIGVLLDVSRAESGLQLVRQEIVTQEFIDNLEKQSKALTTAKNICLCIVKSSLPESFSADPFLLMRAVMNLVTNGVEYSPEGSKLCIRISVIDGKMRICVIDSGRGFSPEAKAHAAEQFYMDDQSRTSKAHYGIGLYVASSVAEQHGGGLLLENASDTGGGMATIYFPV